MSDAARRPRHRARRRRAAGDGLAARRRRSRDARDPRAPRRRSRDARRGARRCASASRASPASRPVVPPAEFTGELRPYQQAGLDFLAHASSLGLGAVLADDMGLGKTVQALAWLAAPARARSRRRPEPGRLPGVGRAQLGARGGALRAALRVLLLTSGEEPPRARGARSRAHDLVVTNYALLRRDVEALEERRAARRDPRRGAEHQEPERRRDPRRARRSTPSIAWRSPARRSRTARSTCGASCRS